MPLKGGGNRPTPLAWGGHGTQDLKHVILTDVGELSSIFKD